MLHANVSEWIDLTTVCISSLLYNFISQEPTGIYYNQCMCKSIVHKKADLF